MDWDEADDLSQKGMDQIEISALELLQDLKVLKEKTPELEPVLVSSPMGRALHTAKIILGILSDDFPHIDKTIEPGIQEISNFSIESFSCLAKRDDVNDPKIPIEFLFVEDVIHRINPMVWNSLPENLKDFAGKVESAGSADTRMMRTLNQWKDKSTLGIFVTHDGMVCSQIYRDTAMKISSLGRGHYIRLQSIQNNKWKILNSSQARINEALKSLV